MENCIEPYPDYNQALDSRASPSARDRLRDYLFAKRRWEVHSRTCPQARSIDESTSTLDERPLMEAANMYAPNTPQKVSHRARVLVPHQCGPLEGECRLDVSNLFHDGAYGRVCRTIHSVLTQYIRRCDNFATFRDIPRKTADVIVQKIIEQEPTIWANFMDAWPIDPLITNMLPTLYSEEANEGSSRLPRLPKGTLRVATLPPEAQANEYRNSNVDSFAPTYAKPPTSEVLPYVGYQQPGAYQAPGFRAPSIQVPSGPSFSYNGSMPPMGGSVAWASSSHALAHGAGVAGPSAPSFDQEFWPSY